MTSFLLAMLTCIALSSVIWGALGRDRFIQLPFLVSMVFLGWVLPQLFGLRADRYLPPGSLDKTIVMATLCLLACHAGYAMDKRPASPPFWTFDYGRLVAASAVLSVLGMFFFVRVDQLAAEAIAMHGGAWTGTITIYVFLSYLLNTGMAIALVLHLMKPSVATLLVLVMDSIPYLYRILIAGRRATMVEFGLMLLMVFWYRRRILPPRGLVLSAMVVGALVVNGIADYRAVMLDGTDAAWSGAGVDEIASIDFVGNLAAIARGDAGGHELMNATMDIEATDRTSSFDGGLSLWNTLVFSYIPAQWLGADFKRSLMVESRDTAYELFMYEARPGTTHTGFSDSFQSFWYFGAFNFLVIGYVLSRWHERAMTGSLVAQLLMMLTITGALHAITHSTHHFVIAALRTTMFLLPAFLFARSQPSRASATEAAPRVGWSAAR